MSELGQSRRFGPPSLTSGLPPEADTVTAGRHVSKEPTPDIDDQFPRPGSDIGRRREAPWTCLSSHLPWIREWIATEAIRKGYRLWQLAHRCVVALI